MYQYNRILKTATTIETNAETVNKNVTDLVEKFNNKVIMMNSILEEVYNDLNTDRAESLETIKKLLHSLEKELTNDFKKPNLGLRKQNAKLIQILSQNIAPFTHSIEDNTTTIKQVAQQIEHLLSENRDKIENLSNGIDALQEKIVNLYQIITSLELPNNVMKTSKQVRQATRTLTMLNAKILNDKKSIEKYASEFRHLGSALEDFEAESRKIAQTPSFSP